MSSSSKDALYAKVLQSVASVVQALPPEQIVDPLAVGAYLRLTHSMDR
jgi:hypothetical protein